MNIKDAISTDVLGAGNPIKFYFKISTVFLLISFFGCKPEENSLPKIDIQKPTSNQGFATGDTISVHFTVSDDKLVTSYHIALLNEKDETVASIAASVNESEKDLKVGFPIEPVYLPTGNYVLLITAFDEEASTIASVALRLEQTPKRQVYYLTQQDLKLTLRDLEFNEISSHTFIDSIASFKVNHRNEVYFVHFKKGHLECRKLLSHELVWSTTDEVAVPGLISNYQVGPTFTYLLGTNGDLISVDFYGRLIGTSGIKGVVDLYAEDSWKGLLVLASDLYLLNESSLIVESSLSINALVFLRGNFPIASAIEKDGATSTVHKWSIENKLSRTSTRTIQAATNDIVDFEVLPSGFAILLNKALNFYPKNSIETLRLDVTKPIYIEKEILAQKLFVIDEKGLSVFNPADQGLNNVFPLNNVERITPVYSY